MKKKLALKRSTIRSLDKGNLTAPAGGAVTGGPSNGPFCSLGASCWHPTFCGSFECESEFDNC